MKPRVLFTRLPYATSHPFAGQLPLTEALLHELIAGGAPLTPSRRLCYLRRLTRYGWRDIVPSGLLAGIHRLRAHCRRH